VQYIPNKEEYVSKEQKTDFQREDALYLWAVADDCMKVKLISVVSLHGGIFELSILSGLKFKAYNLNLD